MLEYRSDPHEAFMVSGDSDLGNSPSEPAHPPVLQQSPPGLVCWEGQCDEHLGPQFHFEDPKAPVLDSSTPKA